MADELEKIALFERLVRLGATDIPGTPRLFMRRRSPQELKALQESVEAGWNKRVTNPIMARAERAYLSKMKPGKTKKVVKKLTEMAAEDPLGTVASKAIPIPGASLAYPAAKRGAERLIDRLAPLPA